MIKFPQSFRAADIGCRHKSKTVFGSGPGLCRRGTWPLAIGFCVGGARRPVSTFGQFWGHGRRRTCSRFTTPRLVGAWRPRVASLSQYDRHSLVARASAAQTAAGLQDGGGAHKETRSPSRIQYSVSRTAEAESRGSSAKYESAAPSLFQNLKEVIV